MLKKTTERKIYLAQIRDKACTICIYVDEPEESAICAVCAYSENKPKWKNAHE